jgi:hypothetical protein
VGLFRLIFLQLTPGKKLEGRNCTDRSRLSSSWTEFSHSV